MNNLISISNSINPYFVEYILFDVQDKCTTYICDLHVINCGSRGFFKDCNKKKYFWDNFVKVYIILRYFQYWFDTCTENNRKLWDNYTTVSKLKVVNEYLSLHKSKKINYKNTISNPVLISPWIDSSIHLKI